MFRKKRNYSYYSNYGSSSRFNIKPGRTGVIIVVVVVLIVGVLGFINRNRIKLMISGYSLSQSSEILSLDSEDVNLILSYDHLEHIDTWLKGSDKVEFYDEYEQYRSIHKKTDTDLIISEVDKIFDKKAKQLTSLGYSDKNIWDLLKTASSDDLQYLIDNNLTNDATKKYREVDGYKIQNTLAYIENYKETQDYNYAVNIVNYPFIISSNPVQQEYIIQNTDDLLILVKNGFNLPSNYEPGDLETPNIPIAPDCNNSTLRKACSKALEEMYKAAKELDYNLVLNSGYRSFEQQQAIYDQFETRYGGQYASEYVAVPGASEHQTGLGVDLTSQSVVDGQKLNFGDTDEYKWVVKNASNYGFIVRFPTESYQSTGIRHEPWHLRYVGKDVAKKITENDWLFEDYCLYENVIPEVTEK